MLKNCHGITLTILIVTIIVVIILASVVITTTSLLLQDTKAKAIISNMYLVKGKIEAVYDDYQFSEDVSLLKGTNVSSNTIKKYYLDQDTAPTGTAENLWYKLDANDLPDLGMDKNMLSETATYIVNYETGEVIYPLGVKDSTGNIKYRLTKIKD